MNEIRSIPIYDSSQRGIPALEELREILNYRHLVLQMVRRDIVTRYKRSVLGVAWTMLNPLGTTIIMAIVFSQVFGDSTSGYAAYVLTGLIPWGFFAQSTNHAMVSLVWGGSLLKRIYLPRTIFAVSALGTHLFNLTLSMVPLLVVILISGARLNLTILLFPIPTLFLAMFALGVGLTLSTIAIYFADVVDMYTILMTAWMYLSPVIYKIDMIPPQFVWIVRLNPMFYLINFFRAFVYDGRIPSLSEFLVVGAISSTMLLIGWLIFTSKSDEFAYRV
jgi:ABC-2 type transport system permease protein